MTQHNFLQDREYTIKTNLWNGTQYITVKCNKMSPYVDGLIVTSYDTDNIIVFDTHVDDHILTLYDMFGVYHNSHESPRLSIRYQFTGKHKKDSILFNNETIIFNCVKIDDGVIIENKMHVYGFINYQLNGALFIFERQFFDRKKISRSHVLFMTPDDALFAYFIEKSGEVIHHAYSK